MRIYKSYIVFLTIVFWTILSVVIPISESDILARFWQLSYVIIYVLAFYSIINSPYLLKNKIVRLLIIWSIYVSIINIFFIESSPISYLETLVDINWWPMIFILFYSIFLKDINMKKYDLIVKIFPYFWCIICVLVIYSMMFYSQSLSLVQDLIDQDHINSIFWLLLITPFVFLLDRKDLKYVMLFLALILVIISTKRSALIALSLVIIFSLYRDIFRSRKIITNVIYVSIITLAVYVIYANVLPSLGFNTHTGASGLDRLSETNLQEEARFEFISESWNKFKSKDLINIVFGSGHRSSAIDRGTDMLSKTVHNDFFEILYDYGIVGLSLYLVIIVQIFIRLFRLLKIGGKYYEAYFAAICIYIVLSMVSHLIIYPTYFAFLIIIWALVEAKIFNGRHIIYKTAP